MLLDDYTIPFHGLKDGMHRYNFEVGDSFFESIENAEIKKGKLTAVANLDKKSQMLGLQINVKGQLNVLCDRCLDYFDMTLENSMSLFFKFGDEEKELAYDLIILSDQTHELRISPYIYETIMLGLPYKKVHPDNGCNKDMMQRIKGLGTEQEMNDVIDPRWEKLKELKTNNK